MSKLPPFKEILKFATSDEEDGDEYTPPQRFYVSAEMERSADWKVCLPGATAGSTQLPVHKVVLALHSQLLRDMVIDESTTDGSSITWDCSLAVALAVLRLFYGSIATTVEALEQMSDLELTHGVLLLLDKLRACDIAQVFSDMLGGSAKELTMSQAVAIAPISDRMGLDRLLAKSMQHVIATCHTFQLKECNSGREAEEFAASLHDCPPLLNAAVVTLLLKLAAKPAATADMLLQWRAMRECLPPAVFTWSVTSENVPSQGSPQMRYSPNFKAIGEEFHLSCRWTAGKRSRDLKPADSGLGLYLHCNSVTTDTKVAYSLCVLNPRTMKIYEQRGCNHVFRANTDWGWSIFIEKEQVNQCIGADGSLIVQAKRIEKIVEEAEEREGD